MPASKGAFAVMSTGNATLDAVGAASGAATVELAVEWIVYLVIIIVITALRTYARASIPGRSGFGWDDYLVWIAVVSSCPPPSLRSGLPFTRLAQWSFR